MPSAKDFDVPSLSKKEPIFRDIRRYFCDYCGICRSKKSLIASHVLSEHKEENEEKYTASNAEVIRPVQYSCQKCGVCFKKPAHLKQHMQGHSLERPFICPVDDCHAQYRRKGHLTRHLLCHQGKLFTCPIDNCKRTFAYQATMKRHMVEMHDEDSTSEEDCPKLHTCQKVGCGKTFKYPSKLRKHELSHERVDHSEVQCPEPGCRKYFTNKTCLRQHIQFSHLYIKCPLCGVKRLRKNIKRHLRTHDAKTEDKKIKCSFDGCHHVFVNKSNLNVHIKAVHLEERPFACRIAGCEKRFPFKHVRDTHETNKSHVYYPGDFLVADQLFRSSSRGGRKRKSETIDSLLRKRVVPPDQNSILDDPSIYLRLLLGEEED